MKRQAAVKYFCNGTSGAFTIVELLLALAITGIIGVGVYNIFWTSLRLDDKMRHIHDNYMEELMAHQALSHDLENAVNLDLSGSYPDAVIFDGQKQELSFLTQTPKGIKRVHYYSGLLSGPAARSMIGRVTNPSVSAYPNGSLPIEFLVRQESNLADWLNETTDNTSTQIVAAGLKKGSFNCEYAPYAKDLNVSGAKGIDYQDSWSDKGLPMAVSCSFVLYDSQKPQNSLSFKWDIFLAPLVSNYNEQ